MDLQPRRPPDGRRASSISVLPAVADAVGADVEVLFDGSVRSGQDVMRAIALGLAAASSTRSSNPDAAGEQAAG